MSFDKAIAVRCSRRKFIKTPIEPGKLSKLRALIAQYNKEPGIRIELVLNNGGKWGWGNGAEFTLMT